MQPYYANIGKRLTKSPKIYFYDTGLAAWLLGIRSEEQLALHPLRGNLFENMVINDFYKYFYNKGERVELYFYRDKSQREVDLLLSNPDGTLRAFEIKSGKTFRTDYFDGLDYLHEIIGDKLQSTTVLYDGDQELQQQYNAYCRYENAFLGL